MATHRGPRVKSPSREIRPLIGERPTNEKQRASMREAEVRRSPYTSVPNQELESADQRIANGLNVGHMMAGLVSTSRRVGLLEDRAMHLEAQLRVSTDIW